MKLAMFYQYWLYILGFLLVFSLFLWMILRRKKKEIRYPAGAAGKVASLNKTTASGRTFTTPVEKGPSPSPAQAFSRSVPPDMLMDRVLNALKVEHGDFVSLMRLILSFASAEDLFKKEELLRKFSHVDMLLQLSSRSSNQNLSPIGKKDQEFPSILRSPDIRAAIVSIVRILQEIPEIWEKGGDRLNILLDEFMEKL